MHGFCEGRVAFRRDWSPGLFTIGIEAGIDPFVAGQFVGLGLEINGKFVQRSYSIASAPGQTLEFFVIEVPEGELTPPMYRLGVGEPIYVQRKPRGYFTLGQVPDRKDLWCVATGTGLAPYIAMLRTEEPWRKFQRVIVVHGVRQFDQLAYEEELKGMSEARAGRLLWLPVVSREQGAGALHGRVTTTLSDGRLEEAADTRLDPAHSHVMLCGNPDMIEELSTLLKERGLKRHRIKEPGNVTLEKYW